MNVAYILLTALGLYLVYSLIKRVYYGIRYPGRYTFRGHLFWLNSDEWACVMASHLSFIVNAKAATEAAKASGLAPEALAVMERELEKNMRLWAKLQSRLYVSPTFKVDMEEFQARVNADLKIVKQARAMEEVEVPKDKNKGN